MDTIEELRALPEVADAQRAVDVLSNMAAHYEVATAEAYREAAQDLQRVKAAAKKLEAARDGCVRPLNERVREINAFFRSPADQLATVEKTIKRAMAAYADEQERIRREEQRKADEAARKERERLAAQAVKAVEKGRDEKALELQERADAVVAPVVQREAPKVAGVATREVWRFEIERPELVPREMCVPDEKRIRAVVQALKGESRIAGVRVWKETTVVAGAA